jgi:hypothetical protein
MSLPPERIQVGRCYLTADGEVRMVVQCEFGRVTYRKMRWSNFSMRWPRHTLTQGKFAADAVDEVACPPPPDLIIRDKGTIPPESIQAGRYYLTHSGSIRKVTSTGSDGLVRYRERVGAGPWQGVGTKKRNRHAFAAEVLREVPCDDTPEPDES